MSFWSSDLGALSGSAEDAFSRSFSTIPDGTTALAKIISLKNDSFNGVKSYKIDWMLIEGDFKGQHTFQKIKAFDQDPKVRHKALNMMVLIYKLFGISKPAGDLPPNDDDLNLFANKIAGIKIMQTKPNEEGKVYNYVSEIHPAAGFQSKTGESKIYATREVVNDDSALTRNSRISTPALEDDIPF
jgi:hypothetical protein